MRDKDGKPIYKTFRIIEGRCSLTVKLNETEHDGSAITEDRIYRARQQDDPPEFTGDTFVSDFDFCEYNQPGIPPKFILAGDGTIHPQGAHVNPLDKQPHETAEQYHARMGQLAREAMARAGHPDFSSPSSGNTASSPPVDPRIENARRFEEMEKWDLSRLQKWAADEEINLKGAKDKNAALKAIKEYFQLN
jgi:hypothetical protein